MARTDGTRGIFFALLFFLCLLVLLAAPREGRAAIFAYEECFGAAYADTLLRTSPDIHTLYGTSDRFLELFRERRVDAVEAYDFQAQMFRAGAPDTTYWYPHFYAVIVLAVREDCPFEVRGWKDLEENVRIVLPDASPEREIFTLALGRGVSAEMRLEEALAFFNRLRREGRLSYRALPLGDSDLSDAAHGGDVYVLFSYQAEQLIRSGAPLRILIPQEGTLVFSKGVLSHEPLQFPSDTLSAKLRSFAYAQEVPPEANLVVANDEFLKETSRAYLLSHERDPLRWAFPRSRDDRFFLLVLTLSLTVFWSGTIWQRVLHRGTRRAVLLLAAMLLLWELDRMARLFSPSFDMAFQHLLWYLYYVFRAGLPVALLWIAWASNEDVLDKKMPAWLKSVFAVNLVFAFLILANDLHHQFFVFQWNEITREWQKKLAWGAYVYWTLWFAEVLAALLVLVQKAHRQDAFKISMLLPFALFSSFLFYSVAYNFFNSLGKSDITITTALFFLILLELCLRTGLMASNSGHRKFFAHSRLAMQLVDHENRSVFSSAVSLPCSTADVRTSRMEIPGGAIVWHEDLRLLHVRRAELALAKDTLERMNALLAKEHRIRKTHQAQAVKKRLAEELEAILASKRPILRYFREEIETSRDDEHLKDIVRRLNLLSSYLKKRCVLFLKGEADGRIRPDEISMAISEMTAYLRPLEIHVGVEWKIKSPIEASAGLSLFDFFADFFARAARDGEGEVFCRFSENPVPQATFLLAHAAWIEPWAAAWQKQHEVRVEVRDLGYAFSLRVTLQEEEQGSPAQEGAGAFEDMPQKMEREVESEWKT